MVRIYGMGMVEELDNGKLCMDLFHNYADDIVLLAESVEQCLKIWFGGREARRDRIRSSY